MTDTSPDRPSVPPPVGLLPRPQPPVPGPRPDLRRTQSQSRPRRPGGHGGRVGTGLSLREGRLSEFVDDLLGVTNEGPRLKNGAQKVLSFIFVTFWHTQIESITYLPEDVLPYPCELTPGSSSSSLSEFPLGVLVAFFFSLLSHSDSIGSRVDWSLPRPTRVRPQTPRSSVDGVLGLL